MLSDTEAFNSFAVDDLDKAKTFYGETLKIEIEEFEEGIPLLGLKLPGTGNTMIYPKDDNKPANHTVLNFKVDDVESEVDELIARGVTFERYDDFEQDEKGISEGGGGPKIAWFKDPAGNTIAVLQEN
jgi:predicted enzyme related to lactoylglutathione lyase